MSARSCVALLLTLTLRRVPESSCGKQSMTPFLGQALLAGPEYTAGDVRQVAARLGVFSDAHLWQEADRQAARQLLAMPSAAKQPQPRQQHGPWPPAQPAQAAQAEAAEAAEAADRLQPPARVSRSRGRHVHRQSEVLKKLRCARARAKRWRQRCLAAETELRDMLERDNILVVPKGRRITLMPAAATTTFRLWVATG